MNVIDWLLDSDPSIRWQVMRDLTHEPADVIAAERSRVATKAICREVRDLVHGADPEVVETIKRSVRPYFVRQGNIAALLATKDHVNLFLYDPLVADPDGIITAGHPNKTGRQISIYRGDAINTRALTAMLREIVEHDRAGGWRKVQARGAS